MTKIRVLIADDHKLFISGLCAMLNNEDWIDIVGTASDGAYALKKTETLMPDILLIDVTMPKMSGIEVVRQLVNQKIKTRCLVLSMHMDKSFIQESILAGAMAYVLKEADEQELLIAIRTVRDGAYYFSPCVLNLIIRGYLTCLKESSDYSSNKRLHTLSRRETEVLGLLADGYSTKEVASQLNIGKTTVDTHRRNIMEKLSCTNIAELTRYAIREGLVDIE